MDTLKISRFALFLGALTSSAAWAQESPWTKAASAIGKAGTQTKEKLVNETFNPEFKARQMTDAHQARIADIAGCLHYRIRYEEAFEANPNGFSGTFIGALMDIQREAKTERCLAGQDRPDDVVDPSLTLPAPEPESVIDNGPVALNCPPPEAVLAADLEGLLEGIAVTVDDAANTVSVGDEVHAAYSDGLYALSFTAGERKWTVNTEAPSVAYAWEHRGGTLTWHGACSRMTEE